MKEHKRTVIRILLWMLCIAWFAYIVTLSTQNGQATAQTSMWLTEIIARLLHISSDRLSQLNHLLRAAAHFFAFFVLDGLAYVTVRVTWPNRRHTAWVVIAICVVVAVLDEVKKSFIAGRHLSWPEAGLNAAGVLCGVFIFWFIFLLVGKQKKNT